MRYFKPTISNTTFYELVNKGVIVPFKHLRGSFMLNESLRRMGLREVPDTPEDNPPILLKDLTWLAFTLLDPVVFPAPPWMLLHDKIDIQVYSKALEIAEEHRVAVEEFENPILKLHYFCGALDAAVMQEMLDWRVRALAGGDPIPDTLARN